MGDKEWREKIKKAFRYTIIRIKNKTSEALFRTDFILNTGIWSKFPEEIIDPGSEIEFGSESYGIISGTSGCVIYQITSEQDPFVFKWDIPWFGATKRSHTCSENFKIGIEENPAQKFISYTVQDDLKKSRHLDSVIMTPVIYESWKLQLKRAQRSLLAKIINTTNYTLILKSQNLSNGIWRFEPPKEILSGAEVDFGCESFRFGGTQGTLSFELMEDNQSKIPIVFEWNIGLIGPPSYQSNVFSIETIVSGNHTELLLNFSSDELYITTSSAPQNNLNLINEKTKYLFNDDDVNELNNSSEENDIELMSKDSSLEDKEIEEIIDKELKLGEEKKISVEDSDDVLG